ncbi:MAG: hypothetical protein AW12_02598 [Candidatus Accumulibacter sp. BA-94]|nr:MAG: hypothetical protein AW12_02598 [Candidatus Accumulibacter sp. BA-94]
MTDMSKQMNDWLRALSSIDPSKGSEQLLNALARQRARQA